MARYLISLLVAFASWRFFFYGISKEKYEDGKIEGVISDVTISRPMYRNVKQQGSRVDFGLKLINNNSNSILINTGSFYVESNSRITVERPMKMAPFRLGAGEYLYSKQTFYVDNIPPNQLDIKTVSLILSGDRHHIVTQKV